MPFQPRAEILFRFRRRNFFLPAICSRGIREKASAVWRTAMRLLSLRGAWIRPAGAVPPAGFGGFKETLAGSLCALLLHAGFGGFAQPCTADFAPLLPVAAVDGHIVEGRAVAPADRRIHAAVYGLYGRCGGAGVKFRAIALSIPSVSSLENSRGVLKPIRNAGKFSTNFGSPFGAAGRFFTSGDSSTRTAAIPPLEFFMAGAGNPTR